MHHPAGTPAGPADLALPLALLTAQAPAAGRRPRATELSATPGGRGHRAARRRATAVRG
ncbi:hypothetical protein ABZ454_23160 [Streptomyces sp. NPDC005803]|uniref:hypothetical protein n=1 Tax=Streptomyces sp. NPDC005803 TaxID=3154297 RepID=UPI0033E7CE9C